MLHVHRAERADGLVVALRTLLADPQPDPFAPEVVAVPTRGMERWLTQKLSGGLGATPGRADGICANVEFPSPRALVDEAVAAAAGFDPAEDPWLPERAVWPLLEVVDACASEPWLGVLSAHIAADDRGARRFTTVRHLAGLFDRYALQRPELLRAWADGEDGGVPPGAAWQAELWRRLRERIGSTDPAARFGVACARLREAPGVVERLPMRLALFGLTRLPAGHLDVLRALAAGRDVHLLLLHPSPVLWERVAAATASLPQVGRRRDDPTAGLARNRLLASWGHDSRELGLVVGPAGHHHHHPVVHAEASLLGRLQADVRADRSSAGVPRAGAPDTRPALEPGDESLQVHVCHGRARQVEVVRDAILHELERDPELEPRDVLVMCPDIEAFAPLIHATFGAGDVAGDSDPELEALPANAQPPDLRVRLADRSLRQTNPLLGVVARLVELAGSRVTASQVIDLADREPVRRRFELDDDDLSRLEDWVAESGIRWGLDAAHRAPFALSALPTGTWQAGLDRLLLGVAMTEDDRRQFGSTLPLDDVDSGSIDLAGRFAELVDRLRAALDSFAGSQPVEAWAERIGTAADGLTATSGRDAWQRAELQGILGDVVAEAAGHATALGVPEIRALLADRLRGRPTRANFRTGHLTVCTLVPMRSVPHRVVCLLGLDDGVFPRKGPRDGDDLLLAEPHVGDRDSRTEDRQMLLDALLAATDRLIVTYTGNDERTNAVRPPAVPVGELLDAVDRTVRPAGDDGDAGDYRRGADRDNARGVDEGKRHGQHGATAHDGETEGAHTNVNGIERVLSVAAGGALAAYGFKRRDWAGLAAGVVGGLLVERGVSGHCAVYDAAGLTSAADEGRRFTMPHHEEGGVTRQHGGSATVDAKKAKRVIQTFTIFGRMPGELYDYWRNLGNLPRILQHLESVKELDARRSHWVAKAPAGQTVEWDAEIINDVPGEVLAWRSLPGASVPNAGAVTFREAPAGRGTEVKVNLEYEPPLGKLGVAVAKLFGEEPSVQVREDLRRYKQLMEAGEIPVSYNPGQGKPPRTTFDAKVNRGQTGGDVRGLQQDAAGDAHQAVHQPPPSDQARGANSTLTPKEGR